MKCGLTSNIGFHSTSNSFLCIDIQLWIATTVTQMTTRVVYQVRIGRHEIHWWHASLTIVRGISDSTGTPTSNTLYITLDKECRSGAEGCCIIYQFIHTSSASFWTSVWLRKCFGIDSAYAGCIQTGLMFKLCYILQQGPVTGWLPDRKAGWSTRSGTRQHREHTYWTQYSTIWKSWEKK